MIFDIGLACVCGGGLMIAFAVLAQFIGVHGEIKNGVKEMTETTKTAAAAAAAAPDGAGAAGAGPQASVEVVKDYLDGLANLAGQLSKLTPSVAALIVSTILFGLGSGLAAIDYIHEKTPTAKSGQTTPPAPPPASSG